jgi:Ca2+:H+ antiporter
MVFGLDSTGVSLLALALVLSALTFWLPRRTIFEGPLHLVIFLIYVVLIFSP